MYARAHLSNDRRVNRSKRGGYGEVMSTNVVERKVVIRNMRLSGRLVVIRNMWLSVKLVVTCNMWLNGRLSYAICG